MSATLIQNSNIVNQGKTISGDILIAEGRIIAISKNIDPASLNHQDLQLLDVNGSYVMPGIIDDQVHFREPGLSHKEDIYSGSKAAIAGGVTTFMEMPNTIPNVFTHKILEEKYTLASHNSLANYSFYLGASNDNLKEILDTDPKQVCGIKIFMGSSTGNMLVDNKASLKNIFSQSSLLIATHCEDEATIRENLQRYQNKFGANIPFQYHPKIRNAEACYKSSSLAIELATKYNTRLHVLHISTAKEVGLFDNAIPLKEKSITAEACIHHLWFDDSHYAEKGSHIKWNPAIKTLQDKEYILQGVRDHRIDVIATDHSPHTLEEKNNPYLSAPSGGPLIQHSLVAMFELSHRGLITVEEICAKMCHAPADCFQISQRGYIKEGFWADLVIIDPNAPWKVSPANLQYKCGWSPFDGQTFQSRITHTFVNGILVYKNDKGEKEKGNFYETHKGKRLTFDR